MIIPLLMLLMFGAIELGIGFSQKGAIESISRQGARTASTLTSEPDTGFGNQYGIGVKTIAAVNAALGTTAVPEMNRVYVYRIKADGTEYGPAGWGGSCGSAYCMYFDYDSGVDLFDTSGQGPGWAFADRTGCGLNADRVGVRVEGRFHFLSNLIGSGEIELKATTIHQLEPTDC